MRPPSSRLPFEAANAIFAAVFTLLLSALPANANPIALPPVGWMADPSVVAMNMIAASILLYFVAIFIEGLTNAVILNRLEVRKYDLFIATAKINFLVFPLTQLVVLTYYYIVKSNQKYYLEPYYFDSINEFHRYPFASEFAFSFAILAITIAICLALRKKIVEKWQPCSLERKLSAVLAISAALILSDIIAYSIVKTAGSSGEFNHLSNFIQYRLGTPKIMQELITRYHFYFFEHYIIIPLEIVVIIVEYFLLKRFISSAFERSPGDAAILSASIFSNTLSLALGSVLLYVMTNDGSASLLHTLNYFLFF